MKDLEGQKEAKRNSEIEFYPGNDWTTGLRWVELLSNGFLILNCPNQNNIRKNQSFEKTGR